MVRALAAALVAALVLAGFHLRASGPGAGLRTAWRALAAAVVLACSAQIGLTIGDCVADPPEWDFRAFWVSARVAAAGHDFYDPASYREIGTTFEHSDDFRREILEVGFWYPPPTMLLFAPLGWLDQQPALAAWYLVQLAALVVAVVVLARSFLPDDGVDGVLLVAALALLVHGTRATFEFAQTNLAVLALLALAWRDRERGASGAWLALAAIVKPWAAVLGLPLLWARAWRAVACAAATAAVAWGLAFAAFGPAPLGTFLESPPAGRVPGYVLVEELNQSLLATGLRWAGGMPAVGGSPALAPAHLVAVAALLAATLAVLARLDRRHADLAWALAIALALVVYPGTLVHYTAVTVLPTVVVWSRRARRPLAPWSATTLVAATVALAELGAGTHAFEAHLLWWAALAWIGVRTPATSA